METLTGLSGHSAWKAIGTRKRAGVLLPVFFLHSRNSVGIGDFGDLRLAVDWAAKTAQSIVQLLPVNEMGQGFCPYDAISSFALEPAYLSLESFRQAKTEKFKIRIDDTRRAFPCNGPYLEHKIKDAKLALLKEIYLSESERGSSSLKRFEEENHYWLRDFALYKALKDSHAGRPWYEWEDCFRSCGEKALEEFQKERSQEIDFIIWLQWQLFRQFKKVKEYANSKGVLLKGDLPILVSRDSADVWRHRGYFKLDFAAGAPPDMYCAKGQRWGMPPYCWENIFGDKYAYLKARLAYAENFYDLLRVDHVVGLFRIWSIPCNEPLENHGLNGFFDPCQEESWKEHGKNILSVILSNTRMLLCAEDLGIIPPCCTQTLAELGIPGNDVQRWVKDWYTRHDFLSPEEYRPLAVAMLSTHDTTNWLAWWENEAGTVDEALFIRKCAGRVDYVRVKGRLFDARLSRHGRLRWLNSVDSPDALAGILGRAKEELGDFIDIYENTYKEKENLWKKLGLEGPMREDGDIQILAAALKITLDARAIFSVQLITDYLSLSGIFKGGPYQYRINTPGTISEKNWSLVMPISLEDLLQHPLTNKIREMVIDSGRA